MTPALPARDSNASGNSWLAGSTLPPALHVVCASTIRATYAADGALDGPARLSIAYDGRFALVGWMRREEGGMSVFERRNGAWCRVANGGGVFTEADLVGFDGIDRATAHRLFTRLTRGGSPRGR